MLIFIGICFCKCSEEYNYKSDTRVSSFVTDSLAIWLVLTEDDITNLDIETKCGYTYSLLDSIIIPEAKKIDRTLEISFSFWEDNGSKPVLVKSLYGNLKTIKIGNLLKRKSSSSKHNKNTGLSISDEHVVYIADFKLNGKYYKNCAYSNTKYVLRCGQTLEIEIYYDPK